MENYIQTIYNEKERPITKYPCQLTKYLIDRFNLKPGSKILDNGCGRGDFLEGFRVNGIDAYGCDLEISMVNKEGSQIIFGGVNFEKDKLPFPDDYFDLVFTKSVIEHIHNPSLFLKEMYRVLKPGGRIVVMVPDWYSCMYIFYDDCTHVQPYTMVGLRDTLRMMGFQNVSSEIFYQLPCVWRYPIVKIVCKILPLLGPVKKIYKNKFMRFSRELMILGTGIK